MEIEQSPESKLCQRQRRHARHRKESENHKQGGVHTSEPLVEAEGSKNVQEKTTEYATKNDELPPRPGGIQQAKRLTQPGNNGIHRKKLGKDFVI